MSQSWDDAIAVLEPLHEALEELASQPGGQPHMQPITDELRACLIAVARAAGPSSELSSPLARAAQLVASLIAAGHWRSDRIAALQPALNLCIGQSFQADWASAPRPSSDGWSGFRASRRRPRVNALPPFCEPEPEYVIPAELTEVPGVIVDYSVVQPLPIELLGKDVVEQCLEDLTLRGRHRLERPCGESAREEQALLGLGDAFCVVGEAAPDHLRAWWQAQTSSDPYSAFAVAYALSVCAGVEHLELLRVCLEERDAADIESPRRAADALQLVARPERRALVEHWQRAAHPGLRAVAIELGSRRLDGPAWLSAEACAAWLTDPNPAVVVAALRGLARHASLPSAAAPQVQQLMLGPLGQGVAIEAARCLALCGEPAPYIALRQDGRAFAAWGEQTLEVLVWFGSTEDAGLLQHLLKRSPQNNYTLDAVARFGVIEAYAYLLHALEQEEWVDAALSALVTLLGPLPPDEDPLLISSWKAQLKRVRPTPGVRYRLGQPWQPRVVASEIASGQLSRLEIAARIDELRVRIGSAPLDVAVFGDELDAPLSDLLSGLHNVNARFKAGSYDCFTRDRRGGVTQ